MLAIKIALWAAAAYIVAFGELTSDIASSVTFIGVMTLLMIMDLNGE